MPVSICFECYRTGGNAFAQRITHGVIMAEEGHFSAPLESMIRRGIVSLSHLIERIVAYRRQVCDPSL